MKLTATIELEVVQATQSLQHIRRILAARSIHMIVIRTRVHMVEPKDGIMREEDLICNLVVNLSTQLFPSLLKNWRWSIKGKQLNLERFVIKKKMKKTINTVRYGSPIIAIVHQMAPGVLFHFALLRFFNHLDIILDVFTRLKFVHFIILISSLYFLLMGLLKRL